jgi:hypothetical protein
MRIKVNRLSRIAQIIPEFAEICLYSVGMMAAFVFELLTTILF